MSNQPCTNCAQLQAEIARLQAEIAMLLRILAAARGECVALANEAEKVMSGHVPKGTWAHAKGQKEAAQKVLSRLS